MGTNVFQPLLGPFRCGTFRALFGTLRKTLSTTEDPIRTLTVSLIGAAALAAAGLLLVRTTREEEIQRPKLVVPPGETQPVTISPERIRALGY